MITVKNASRPIRILVFSTTLALLLGYGVSMLKLYNKTSFSLSSSIQNYRGSDDENLMLYPKTFSEILQITHSHALSVPLVYFVLGLLLLGTSICDKTKSLLIGGVFASFFVEYLSLWGLWGITPAFVYPLTLASITGSLCYLSACLVILAECLTCKGCHTDSPQS